MPPETLKSTGWLDLVDGVIVCTGLPTCHASDYDYFVVSRGIYDAEAVVAIQRVDDGGMKPHFPSRLILRGDGRRKMKRQLVKPSVIPGILPHGPKQHTTDFHDLGNDTGETDNDVTRWYERARADLRQLMYDSKHNEHQ